MRLPTLLAVAVAVVSLPACSADTASETGAATASGAAEEIRNGTTASAYPEAVLVDTSGYLCSGALVAPRVVLTAGHCVSADRYTVTAPFAGQTAHGTKTWTKYRTASSTAINPNAIDVALIFLDEPIALPFYPPLAHRAVADGSKVVNVGRVRNGAVSSTQLFKGLAVAVERSSGYPFSYESRAIVQSGDSGGPAYVGAGDARKIVAVSSGADDTTQILGRVDLVADEIETRIQELATTTSDAGAAE